MRRIQVALTVAKKLFTIVTQWRKLDFVLGGKEKIKKKPMLDKPAQTADELVVRYLALRDHLVASHKRFAEFCAPFKAEMDAIEAQLMAKLNAEGQKAGKTPSGTYYKSRIVTPKVVDRDKYLDAVLENWDSYGNGMLQIGAPKKESIDEYMQANNGTLPPGVTTTSYVHVNIRKS